MKKVNLKLIICLVVVAAVCCILAGCNPNYADDFDFKVTFDYNYGNLNANCPTQFLGVMEGDLVYIQPGYKDSFRLYEVDGYFLEGWYLPKLDEDGNLIKMGQNGETLDQIVVALKAEAMAQNPDIDFEDSAVMDQIEQDANALCSFVQLDRKWDFENEVVTQDITLYANLLRKITLTIKDRETDEVLDTIIASPGSTRQKPAGATEPSKEGYTFKGVYYTQKEGDETFEWPYTFGTEDVTIYVDFLQGEWNIVSNAAEFFEIMKSNSGGTANIYLVDDIDCGGEWYRRAFGGVIEGNGHTISNITVSISAGKGEYEYGGLFNNLNSGAKIMNVTFENVNVNFELTVSMVDIHIGLFARKLANDVVLENVAVVGTLTYSSESGAVTGYAISKTYNEENIIGCDFSQVNLIES